MAKIITEKAVLECNKGTASSTLEVTSQDFYYLEDKKVATEKDKQPQVNIFPFGKCQLQPSSTGYLPCVPSTQSWSKTATKDEVEGNKILLDHSICSCSVGGEISVKDIGHTEEHDLSD